MFHQDGLLTQPRLYLNLYLKQHRSLYYELLDGVRVKGNWQEWVDFFLIGIEPTSQGAVQTAKRLVTIFDDGSRRIHATWRSTASTRRVPDVFRRRPVINLERLFVDAGMTFLSATKAMGRLVEATTPTC